MLPNCIPIKLYLINALIFVKKFLKEYLRENFIEELYSACRVPAIVSSQDYICLQ